MIDQPEPLTELIAEIVNRGWKITFSHNPYHHRPMVMISDDKAECDWHDLFGDKAGAEGYIYRQLLAGQAAMERMVPESESAIKCTFCGKGFPNWGGVRNHECHER